MPGTETSGASASPAPHEAGDGTYLEALAKPLASTRGTGILPVLHGRGDAHATRGFARSVAIGHKLAHGAGRLLDLVYPRICPLCSELSDRPGRLICWRCFTRLPLHTVDQPHCRHCGLVPEGEAEGQFLCDVCRRAPPAFDMARTAAPFRSGVRVLLHDFKYNSATWYRADLTDLLEGALRTYYDPAQIDFVLPVPLHAGRLRKRGYNQSALLAASLARRFGLEASTAILQRFLATPTQTHLSAAARRQNVHGAFRVVHPEWVRGRTLLVIDDVMTTGATLHEVARALKRAGAWRVWVLAVARG
ncbi:MAG: ComF family protein [Lentisphaerae bacterium]|jgi:ComF family protein|nr:ComF family protein [Lentisphaerota bacterium]